MKKLIIIVLSIAMNKAFGQGLDSARITEIPASYADRIGEPLQVQKDSLYVFRTSDIFLINKKSFVAIKNVYQSAIDQDKMTKELVEKYTTTLRRNMDLERALQENFAVTDSLDQRVYEKTQQTLINTQRVLDFTANSLEKATNSLVLVEKAGKRERQKTLFEKILIGVAGAGIGVLVGISL